ncbi:Vms1/Ankzf1 family peptidyl-tRNA hydrolase [Corynebacterium halotolerans]|uniref:baeRF2 domain-containing protein n=1 Tax=Corynebacterium halotolerans TaxID=225326 RepID=UPI003CF9381A
MKLPWLKSALEQEGPFLTVYFDTTRMDENAASEIANRWQHLRSRLEEDNAPKKLLARIEDTLLRPSSIGGRHGRAIIASGEDIVIDRVLPAPPSEDACHYGDKPLLLPLLRLTPHAVRQLLIEVDRAGADLHLRSATDPSISNSSEAAQVDGGHDELHKASSGGGNPHGWRADNFQARVEDSWERNAEAVAETVNKLVLTYQPDMVLLTGDVRAQSLLKAELRQEVTQRLQEVPGGTRGVSLQRDSFRAELKKVTEEFAANKQRDLAEQFRESQARDGASVGGATEVAQALERGQVDELLFLSGQEPDGIEELLFQAITTDAGVDALDAQLVDLLDGVGALLRWRDEATPSNAIGSMGGDPARIDAVDPTRDDPSPRAEEEAAIRR